MGVSIVGLGIHQFGRTDGVTGREQGAIALRRALVDAGISWSDVRFAAGGSHSSGAADALVSELGLTTVPFINVSNGCATGGSALTVAAAMIESGVTDIALAVGFDKHRRGAFNADAEAFGLPQWYGQTGLMVTTQFFGMKIARYMHDNGIEARTLAQVAAKAYTNGALNDNAWRRTPLSVEDILAAPMVNHPLTQYMFCSPGEGAVALVLCRDGIADRYCAAPVSLRAVTQRTRRYGSFEVWSPYLAPERANSATADAAAACFDQAGIGPDEVQVAQLQDTEAGAEIMHMAETGLCKDGDQQRLISDGATEIGGCLPINTDGGLISNGEPIGASGLRQVHEIVLQLQGRAGARQVPGTPTVGFTQVYGAPGVSACTVLTR